jgi:hypothetical protein
MQCLAGFGMHRETGVDLAVIQGIDHLGDAHFGDSDFGEGFFLAAEGQQLDDLRLRQMVSEADAQLPAVAPFRGTHAGTDVFHERQHAAGIVPKDLAGSGEPYAPLLAEDQGNLQIRFDFPNRPGKGRGINVNLCRGVDEALFFGNGQEVAKISKSHNCLHKMMFSGLKQIIVTEGKKLISL